MPKVKIIAEKQKSENTCWLACTRMVGSAYGLKFADDDKEMAKDCHVYSIEKTYDIQKVLERCELWHGTDDGNVPTFKEISDAIDNDRPLVACVTTKAVRKDRNIKDGHYIVIYGYENSDTICIVDPDDGNEYSATYDSKTVAFGSFKYNWGMTYYSCSPKDYTR